MARTDSMFKESSAVLELISAVLDDIEIYNNEKTE
jgi:hypothetical protein